MNVSNKKWLALVVRIYKDGVIGSVFLDMAELIEADAITIWEKI